MFRGLGGSDFLRAWHAVCPGKSSATFGYARIAGDGRSSYALLVDDAAALSGVQRILDLACGDGYLLELLARRLPSAELIGVDMTPQELDLARSRGLPKRVRIVEGNAHALPLDDACIDAAVCHMALMLFDDAPAVIGELARVMRPGGLFAAVLGPAPGSSAFMARVLTRLREAENAEELAPLAAGDPRTFKEESLRSLFTGDAWCEVHLDDFQLVFEGPDERVLTSLLTMYQVARLSEEGQARLRRKLADEMAARRASGEPAECVLGLRHLKVLRNFTSRSVS